MTFGVDWKLGLTPIAYVRASKVWKGRVEREAVPIVYITSCDIGLVTRGEKLRILLTGDGVFRADQGMNGGGVAELRAYNAEIDRLAGQRRPSALAHFPGESLPPSRRQCPLVGELLPNHTACQVGPNLYPGQRHAEVGFRAGLNSDPRRRRSAPRYVSNGDSLEDRAR